MFKSGFVAVIGKPNAGKSSLINSLVGYKVAIITPKPQTTRFNIKAIRSSITSQIIFIDTPGVHKPKHKLGKYMMKSVEGAIDDVDILIYLVDATKKVIDEANKEIIKNIAKTNKSVILVINKIDLVKKEEILKIIEIYNNYILSMGTQFDAIIPISVSKNDGLDILVREIENLLPEGNLLYPEDEVTDITEREIVEETIREKALKNLNEEIPHGIIIEVQKMKLRENEEMYDIEADIICQKKSHKPIVIGEGGSKLKKIGTDARLEIEKMLDTKVNLKLWVKIREDWIDNDLYLKKYKLKKD